MHYEGDYTGEYTDVYSRMYSTLQETESIGGGDRRRRCSAARPAEAARQRVEAVHPLRVRARDGQRPRADRRVRGPGRPVPAPARRLRVGVARPRPAHRTRRRHGVLRLRRRLRRGRARRQLRDGRHGAARRHPDAGARRVRGRRGADPPGRLGHHGARREPVPLGLDRRAPAVLDPVAERRRRGLGAPVPRRRRRPGVGDGPGALPRCSTRPRPNSHPATSSGSTSIVELAGPTAWADTGHVVARTQTARRGARGGGTTGLPAGVGRRPTR